MLRCRAGLRLCAAVYRDLDPNEVLAVVQSDGGETSAYYATRYFGPKTEKKVNHILWNDLKKRGFVDMQRGSDLASQPKWYATAGPVHRAPKVYRHREEDHDLSVLKKEQDLGKEQESEIISQLRGETQVTQDSRVFATRRESWKIELDELSLEASSVALPGAGPDVPKAP
jgi:hypothetical protein